MEAPGTRVHLWIFIVIQIAVWITPPVSATDQVSTPVSTVTATPDPVTTTTSEVVATTTTEPTTTKPPPRGFNESCSSSLPCDVNNNMACNDTSQKCQCDGNHYLDTTKTKAECTERLGLGEICDLTNNQCATGLECNNSTGSTDPKCRIPVSGSTDCGTSDDNCVVNAVCDSGTCKLDVGKACTSGDNTTCKTNTTCVNVGNTGSGNFECRLGLGQTCDPSTNIQCATGLECNSSTGSTDPKCRIPVAGSTNCSTSDDNCVVNAVCDSGSCRLGLGQTCDPSTNIQCATGLECNSSTGSTDPKCRIPVAGSTDCGTSNDNCVVNAVCDSSTCKLDVGKTCNGVSDTRCKSGTACVYVASSGSAVYQCRKMLGQACSDSIECLSTLLCSTRTGSTKKCRIPASGSVSCANSNDYCVQNTVCDTTNICRKILGQACSNSNECLSTLSCSTRTDSSDSKCRIPASGSVSCANSNDYCVQNTVCDTTNICRKILGQACSNSNECLSTLSCSTRTDSSDSKCRIPASGSVSCANSNDYCVQNTVCDTTNICRKILGQACSNSNECLSTLSCSTRTDSSDSKCRIPASGSVSCANSNDYCVQNTVCDTTNICRKILGQACSNSNECLSTLSCSTRTDSSDSKCRIRVGSDVGCSDNDNCAGSAQCFSGLCRKEYASPCSVGTECQTTQNQKCIEYTPGTERCLCEGGYFKQSNGSCISENLLDAQSIAMSGSHQEKSISLTWPKPAALGGALFDCQAKLSSGQTTYMSNWTSNLYHTFSGLTQGNTYTATIYTRTLSNTGYGNAYAQHGTPGGSFYTKPAKPGNLTMSQYPGPDVTLLFHKSEGHVDCYTAWIENKSALKPVNICVNSPIISASFNGLDQGAYYNVSIKATINRTNQPALESEINSQQFRVKANISGKVSDLSVSVPGNRSVEVTWKRPQKTGGVMTGYKVLAIASPQETCVSAVMFVCTNCNITMKNEQATVCTKVNNETTTQSELNNTNEVFNAILTGLLPDVNYTIKVAPYNEEGVGLIDPQYITTRQEPAEPLQGPVGLERVGKGQLNVSWTPGTRTGPTNYTITWEEETSIGSGTYSPLDQTIIQGYNTQFYVISDLLSYWNYKVNVQVSAPLGSSNQVDQVEQTASSAPQALKSVNITQRDTAQSVEVRLVCPDEKKRNGRITKFTYTSVVTSSNQPQTPPQGNIPVDPDVCSITHNIPVTAEKGYNFTFRAVNYEGQQGIPTSQTVTVVAKAPMLEKPVGGPGFMKTSETSPATTKSVPIEMCSCLLDPKEGNIIDVGLKICNKATDCKPAVRGTNYKDYYDKLKTWKQFRDANFIGVYRSSEKDLLSKFNQASGRRRRSVSSRRVARAAENYLRYVIGENQTCETAAATEYCNGPLPSDTEFIVIVWACTAGGCSEAQDPIVIHTQPEPGSGPNIGGIVGGVVAAFAAIAVVVAIILFVMYRRRQKDTDDDSDDGGESPREIKVIRKPIKLKEFASHLETLHKDANMRFQEEFEDVQENSPKHYAQEAATLDANKVKNRYVNILPYDHTRVKMETDDDDETSDFINANYIPGYTSPREYIASQGPMVGTISDFWRMLWEQKTSIIVMLSDLQEKGRPKVDQYWPTDVNAPVQYGDIVVELTSDSTLNKYTIRNFKLYLENIPDHTRVVVQYFIPGWEDYSANLNPDDVIDFISTVRQNARSSQGPICVHCSAGVGRTGTFIALDFLMQFVNEHSLEDEVDIYNLVLNMRHNRPYMVQSERQYVFIHDTLKLIIDRKIKEMQAQNEDNIYQNTGNPEENIYANQAYEPEENLYENSSAFAGKPTTSL